MKWKQFSQWLIDQPDSTPGQDGQIDRKKEVRKQGVIQTQVGGHGTTPVAGEQYGS